MLNEIDLALALFDCGAVKTRHQSPDGKGFKLKLHETNPDAPLSPIYLNLRTADNPKPGPIDPELMDQIGDTLFHLAQVQGLEYDCVAGLPNAGDPFAEAFVKAAANAGVPTRLLKLRKNVTEDKRTITEITSGEYAAKDIVLLIDDLVTRADTKLEGIRVCEEHGLIVQNVLVLVDREQGGAAELSEQCYDLVAMYKISELLQIYLEQGRMVQSTHEEIVAYLKS